MYPFDLSGKLLLVTGASSGIGQESAIKLAELGARLVLVGRDKEKLKNTECKLSSSGHIVAPFDLRQTETIFDWLEDIVQNHGRLHGLVHCAGLHMIKPLKLMEFKDYQNIFDINLGAAFILSKVFCHKLISFRPASIIFISSVAGICGEAGISAYSASKGALISLTKSLAIELANESIRVNCVVPGIVKTPMSDNLLNKMAPEQVEAVIAKHPLGIGSAEDIAYSIAFLFSDAAKWITGTNLIVDGGFSIH